jgi:cytochrome c551/c552
LRNARFFWVWMLFAGMACAQGSSALESQRVLVAKYCSGCHNDSLKSGGFSWTTIDVAHPEKNAEAAEKVIRKLRSGMMPPSGMPRPEGTALKDLAIGLETRIDRAASTSPDAGTPELRRLNRREYHNSVRDLLAVDSDVSALLPPDARTGSFDNMAEALTVTPALMQAYVRAADAIARLAVGDLEAPPVMTQYDVPKVVNQLRHVEGAPFGTRGGISVMHNFPVDGDYSFRLELWYVSMGELIGRDLPESLQGQQIEVSVDGERVGLFKISPLMNELGDGIMTAGPVPVKAGAHRVSAAFLSKFEGPIEDEYQLWQQELVIADYSLLSPNTMLPHLRTMTVIGPVKVHGISQTPSRRKIFECYPQSAAEEQPCAKRIIAHLATKAFRRPSTPTDLEDLVPMYELGRKNGTFDDGIRTVVQTILAMPDFIFRFERLPEGAAPGKTYRISDMELATRLSYFLWNSTPDDILIEAARQGKLRNPAAFQQQVKRMLADPRSETLANNFAMQWLRINGMDDAHPEGYLFPNYTKNLGQSMKREVELLFDSIVREDRNILDLLTANYTFVDEVLARHYGIPNIVGTQFRRVTLDNPERFGLLGKGAVLTITSLANRTSPVARGKYVMEVLLGSPPPLPPPNVPPFKETANNDAPQTVRARMEEHRRNPACASCHKMMDPIGLTLENFDAIGRWRNTDYGLQIDPSSQMYDGSKLDGPVTLRDAVLKHSDAFIGNFAENLFSYALGRVLDYRDMPAVRSIVQQASADRNRFSAFVFAIVSSAPFQTRTVRAASDVKAK